MQLNNLQAKQEMKSRLRRLEGQIRGVQNMLDEERDCKEIIQQLSSIRSAVQSASTYFLREYTACSMDQMDPDDVATNRRIMDDLISLISKAS
jgi:DNA-binding FrmR family transcriptional regulator